MAITLVMMAAAVTVFANISNSVSRRRATMEMNTQLRHVRGVLQRDLAGATCPAIPWQRPESNHGYLEIIEGPRTDYDPSIWLRDTDNDGIPDGPGGLSLDLVVSQLPSSNALVLPGSEYAYATPASVTAAQGVTDGRGLGDWDDTLMLTVRNETEPFVGRVPQLTRVTDAFPSWNFRTVESPLAEVVWYAIENPVEPAGNSSNYFFGEGFRTIYRRTLLILPSLDLGLIVRSGSMDVRVGPGVVRVLGAAIDRTEVDQALASLVAFQSIYDLSVRLEWDPQLGDAGRWKLVANTLADLSKRENRYEHHGHFYDGANHARLYPFAALSTGSGYSNGDALRFVQDPDYAVPTAATATITAVNGAAVVYNVNNRGGYSARPFAYINATPTAPATARAILNENGQLAYVSHGMAPLAGERRGQDVMLTDAAAFDLRVFDPGAPLYQQNQIGLVVQPSDVSWSSAYLADLNLDNAVGSIAANNGWAYVGQGAYVDMGYAFDRLNVARSTVPQQLAFPGLAANLTGTQPRFLEARAIKNVSTGLDIAPGYSVYDTWSRHFENNGIDEDGDGLIDESTNGFDDMGVYPTPPSPAIRNGVDDPGERETAPPYDTPLRGVQVSIRAYERDSRQLKEVSVRQALVPK